ncbi:MAG: TatD family hydrolase [Patescibacteria group bacterium]
MSRPKYIDAHTHAHFAAFKDDYKEVIERALDAGVSVINVGTQKDTSARAVEVAHEFLENVWAVVGLHPIHTEKSYHDPQELGSLDSASISNSRELENKGEMGLSRSTLQDFSEKNLEGFTSRGEDFDYEYYKRLALDPKTVAIGECGLDYYHVTRNMKHEASAQRQKEAFVKQIELAYDVKKPLMIHCRDAFSDLVKVLEENKSRLNDKPGIVHFFSGTVEDAKKLLDLGFYFTFGGVITFPPKEGQPPAGAYSEVIKMIPMDRLLSETDAPYVTPVPFRGKRNEPAYVVYVVRKLAELKGVSEEVMAEQIWGNAEQVLGVRL